MLDINNTLLLNISKRYHCQLLRNLKVLCTLQSRDVTFLKVQSRQDFKT